MEIDARGSEKSLSFCYLKIDNIFCVSRMTREGSGTTGHAVMQLNKEDGGNRKYILCTNNENNICEEVTYKRLKNIEKELPHNLKYLKTDYIPKISKDEDDLSIRKKVEKNIKELIELENHIEVVYNVTTARDNFIYDEENFKIVDKRNNESYTMGSTMKVSIVSASYAKMEIEVIPYVEEKVKIDEVEEE